MSQPISMPWSAPVFPPLPHRWQGVRMAVIPFTPRPGSVERILPPGMETAEGPGMLTLLSYPPNETQHAFNEFVLLVPVRVDDTLGSYVPHIYVNTDEALIPGREIAGFPKLLADVEWERDGSRFRGSVTRWGVRIFSVEGEIRGPMPEQAGAATGPGGPSLNYKLIPDASGGIAIEEITKTQLEIVPREREIGQARFRSDPSDWDAVADIVPEGEGPLIVMLSDNTIPAGEVLKQIKRRERA
jgi:acetoacetate decarboxylase